MPEITAEYKPGFRKAKSLVAETVKRFKESNVRDLGAALAYFTIFALIPLITVIVIIVGSFLGNSVAQSEIFSAVQSAVGPSAASLIQSSFETHASLSSSILTSLIGAIVLIVAVIGLTTQLQESLDRIFCKELRKVSFFRMLKEKIISISIVFILSFFLLGFLLVSSGVSYFAAVLAPYIPFSFLYIDLISFILNLVFVFGFCVINFRFLPNIKLKWRSILYGSVVTSILFVIGKFILGLYLNFADPGSAYGAAGALLVILLWIYYSSLILFLGACISFAIEHTR